MTDLVLRELRTQLGDEFLAYLLNAPADALRTRINGLGPLSPPQERRLDELRVQLAHLLELGILADDAPGGASLVSAGLFSFDAASGTSMANVIRGECGGGLPIVPRFEDELSSLLAQITADVFPATLLPPMFAAAKAPGVRPDHLSTAIFQHPHCGRFAAAASEDRELATLFPNDTGSNGPSGFVMASTGLGTGIQVSMLADALVASAYSTLSLDDAVSAQALITQAVRHLEQARKLAGGRRVGIKARLGVVGVRLAEGVRLETPWGVLRAPTAGETAAMTGVPEAHAESVFELPVQLRLYQRDPEEPWSENAPATAEHRRLHERLDAAFTKLALTLLLGLERARPLAAVRTWTLFDDVMQFGTSASWRSTPPFAFATEDLQAEDLTALNEWCGRVKQHYNRSLDIAVHRALAALAQRTDAADALIDAVIALENLFGGAGETGEVTFRVSTACAFLLEPDHQRRRRELRREAVRVYKERSAVVHGRSPGGDIHETREIAVALVMRSLRELFTRRPELIPNRDRGIELILGFEPGGADARPG